MTMQVINPATGRPGRTYATLTADEASAALDRLGEGFYAWRARRFPERAHILMTAATLLKERRRRLARVMAEEMGKPVREGEAEAEKCARVCSYYAAHGEAFLRPEEIATDATKSYAAYRPLGCVLAVMPWNFPFWQVFRFAAPALMAGNTAALKHASNVPGCALAIEDLLREAGVPEDAFRTLLVPSAEMEALIRHPAVRAVTLTGSVPAGRKVAEAAGRALRKTVMELGGSDPYVVLADADLEAAAETCAASRLINSGQSCIAAKRFIVEQPVYERFTGLLAGHLQQARVGDPMDPDTQVGPLARADLRDELHAQVTRSLEQGARRVLGGEVPDGPGAYYPPTLLADVRPGMPAFDEELFGPVAAVVRARDEKEAIRLANASDFGLGAAVFTRDAGRGEHIAAGEVEAGCCFVNSLVRSDPRLPFGGIKDSGYGRELSHWGIREFVNVKTVYVK